MSGALSQVFSSLQELVQNFESGGNYAAVSPTSTASGAYQFTNPTWQQYAGQLGIDLTRYPTASSAPASVQDQVFGQAVSQNGLNDWTCPGCDAPLSNYLLANPSAANLPTFAGGSSNPATSQGGSWLSNFLAPGFNYNDTTPQNEGVLPQAPAGAPTSGVAQAGAALSGAGGVSGIFGQFTNWLSSIASRAGLFVLAVLFIIGALVLFGIKSGIEIESSPQ